MEACAPTTAEAIAAREAFDRLPSSSRREAERRFLIACELADAAGKTSLRDAVAGCARKWGISPRTLYRWHACIAHLADRRDWMPQLAPGTHRNGTKPAECDTEAWESIRREYLTQSKPALRPVYRRVRRDFAKQGIALPSYDAIARKIEREISPQELAYLRGGNEALAAFYPPMRRDPTTLALHEIWCSDGRKADVFCRWPGGEIYRPIIVAWQELRSRKVLGFACGPTESAELVRLSFGDAAQKSGALPSAAYVDNGRAYASKQITGQSPTRNRFVTQVLDPHGLLVLFGVDVIWATPYNGRAKPIESYWNTIAEAEKAARFVGAYCGNKPQARPEEFDPRRAVPIADYIAAVRDAIEEKNADPHRGEGMDGKSPDELYAELMRNTPVRHATAAQLRLCLTAAESVRLTRPDRGLTLFGNRYWSEAAAGLRKSGPFTARYNPNDLSAPVSLYDGEQYLCDLGIRAKTGFRDTEAAKANQRATRAAARAVREQANAHRVQAAAKLWNEPVTDESPAPTPPTPAIPQLVPNKLRPRNDAAAADAEDEKRREYWRAEMDRREASAPWLHAANGL